MDKKYRTNEQIADVLDDAKNGNFTRGGEKTAEYGIHAVDFDRYIRGRHEPEDMLDEMIEAMSDAMYLIQEASKYR